eukprot:scaffold8804_cov161-Ochromonas_danica.AAC.8
MITARSKPSKTLQNNNNNNNNKNNTNSGGWIGCGKGGSSGWMIALIFFLSLIAVVLVVMLSNLYPSSVLTSSTGKADTNHLSIHPLMQAHPSHWHQYVEWLKQSMGHDNSSSIISSSSNKTQHQTQLRGPVDLVKETVLLTVNNTEKHATRSVDVNVNNQLHNLSTINKSHPIVASSGLPSNHYIHKVKDPLHNLLLDSSRPVNADAIHKHYSCQNQTMCYPSVLQLEKVYKLVDDPHEADYIIYLPESSKWDQSECNNPLLLPKLVILDESDSSEVYRPPAKNDLSPFLTFKRSYVRRQNGVFQGYMKYLLNMNILPMTYPVAEAYIKPKAIPIPQRALEIVCTLRGGGHDPTRRRVREFVEEYGKTREIVNIIAGEVNQQSRTVISKQYFEQMATAKIIVTSNPSHWEGDFRLCEAMASGALIFVDEMYVPRPFPFQDHQHLIYYNNKNKTDLFAKLDAIRSNPERLQEIALRGFAHALTFHRAVNLIDYIFCSVHVKERALQEKVYNLLNDNGEFV